MSAQEIGAEGRCLSAAEAGAVWGTGTGLARGWHGPFMQGFALWGRHLWPWLWGTYTGDDGDKMAFREVILDPLEVLLISPSAPIERESMLHSIMKNNCSRVLTKAIWNHILPFQTVHYFIFRSCFQMAHRGLLNDYSVESTSEPILFPWGPHLSQLPVPENSTESLPLFSLCHLDSARGTFSLRSCVLYCCSPWQPGQGKSESPLASCRTEQSQHRMNHQRFLGAKLTRVFIGHI